MNANQILNRTFGNRKFEVYSVASGEALSDVGTFNETYTEMEKISYAGIGSGNGISNGIDMREVK